MFDSKLLFSLGHGRQALARALNENKHPHPRDCLICPKAESRRRVAIAKDMTRRKPRIKFYRGLLECEGVVVWVNEDTMRIEIDPRKRVSIPWSNFICEIQESAQ